MTALPSPIETDIDMRAAALDLAERGFRVFPVHSIENGGCTCGKASCGSPGKHPLTKTGFKAATLDLDQVARWWAQWPRANIGMPTGGWCVVLDIDPSHGGAESLAALEDEHGPLPQTAETRTGSGGSHFFFAHPGGVISNRTNIRAGIDLRGDGGYVVVPPSNHITGGRYLWVRHPEVVEMSELPSWLLNEVQTP